MTATRYKIQYDLDAGLLIIPLTVFFTFSPGAPETRMQPADPDEIEITEVFSDHLNSNGEIAMERALNASQAFMEWLEANREKAEML